MNEPKSTCPRCERVRLRKERREWWKQHPSPRLIDLRLKRWDIAYSEIDASYERIGQLLWYGRTSYRLASEFRFHISIDQARQIISLNPTGTHMHPTIREALFPETKKPGKGEPTR